MAEIERIRGPWVPAFFAQQPPRLMESTHFHIQYHAVNIIPQLDRSTWPLLDCAWVFQEHLLSPRTVFYGQQNIVWKRGAAYCNELLGNIRHDYCFYNEHGAIEARPLDSYSQRDDVKRMSTGHLLHSSPYPLDVSNTSQRAIGFYLATWNYLFNDYDTLHLTVEHDRIVAFSGVTRASQLRHGLTYLAGAWAESKQYYLLWRYPTTTTHITTKQPAAPSWSWWSASRTAGLHSSIQTEYCRFLYDDLIFSARLIIFQ
jgi:hypothetical protein